jgi:mannosyltransferase OCH1-like enzyme
MFKPRSNTKLPFYKSYNKRSTKQKKKLVLRIAIVAIIFIFLFGRWHKSSSNNQSVHNTNTFPNKLNNNNNNNPLEVRLKTPATSDAKDFKELTIARETSLSPVGDRIPKIVHFVYGLRDPEPTLDLIHYTVIKSAYDVLKPKKIMFHYHYMPVGKNFERAKPMLTLRQVPLVTKVFDRPVSHYAHRADVVRLEVLEEFGGIYLDLDLISLKPVDHLLDREFVMAQEGIGKNNRRERINKLLKLKFFNRWIGWIM